MRKVTLTAYQYNNFAYPQVAMSTAETDEEMETAIRLISKLRFDAKSKAVPLTKEEEKRKAEGKPIYPFRELVGKQADFILEEDEWVMMKNRMAAHKTQVMLAALDDFVECLKAVEEAPPEEIPEE